MADYIYLNPDYVAMLRREGLVNLNRLLEWSTGELVGEHGLRTTWRTTLPDGEGRPGIFYIRQERRIPPGEIVADLLRIRRPASRSCKTLRATELFTAGGISVAPLCGLIERRHLDLPFRAALVQGQAPGKDLYAQLLTFGRPQSRTNNPPARQRLLYELGGLIAKINRAKIHWPDLVAKHIYVEPADPVRPGWRFTLIDIERAEPGLTGKRRDRQMNQLLVSLRGLLTGTDLVRMAMGYLGLAKAPRAVRRRLWEKFLPRGAEWLKRSREEMAVLRGLPEDRPLPEEELFERVNGLVVNMRYKPALAALGLLEKGAIFSFHQGVALHKPGLGRRLRMRFETLLDGNRVWLYMKRIRYPGLSDQLDRIASGTIRHSRCWHERSVIKGLGRHRIPTPVVVAYAEKMFLAVELKSVLLTQGLVGQSLERFVPKHFARGAGLAEVLRRRRWIVRLGELIGRFHRAGFCHRDLYLSHIFIGFRRDGEPVFYLIDLARAFRVGFRRSRWFVKDLAALHFSSPRDLISNSDRMRFLRAYLGKNRLEICDKKLVRKILAKAARMNRHYRKGRRAHP